MRLDRRKCEWLSTHMKPERPRQLSTAEERRATVLHTAIGAFAARGYFGTTTTEVAKAAGISQAYVYRLFPSKESLFVAVVEHCFVQVRASLERAATEAPGSSAEAVLAAMGESYARLISDNDLMLIQLQAQAAAASEPASCARSCARATPAWWSTYGVLRAAVSSRSRNSSRAACCVT